MQVAPPVVDIDAVVEVEAVAAFHDEAREVTQAVAAVGVEGRLMLARRQKDLRSALEALTVEPHLLGALESRPVLHRGREHLIQYASVHYVDEALTSPLSKLCNAPLNEVGIASPVLAIYLGICGGGV